MPPFSVLSNADFFDTTISADDLSDAIAGSPVEGLFFDRVLLDPPNGDALIFGEGKFLTYRPDPSFQGSDVVQVSLSTSGVQGSEQFITTLDVLVEAADDQPVAFADGPFDAQPGIATTFDAAALLANDAGGGEVPLVIERVQTERPFDFQELFVTLSGDVQFALSDNFIGTTRFNYKLETSDKPAATADVILRTPATAAPLTPGNNAPAAVNDGPIVVKPGVPTTLDTADLLRNDADADGHGLTLIFVKPGTTADFAELALDPTGGVRLELAEDFRGETASFSYTAIDPFGAPTIAEATLMTSAPDMPGEPVSGPPVAADDGPILVVPGAAKTLAAAALLANDVAADGDALEIVDVATADPFAFASLLLNGEGDVELELAEAFSGETTLSYTIADTNGSEASAEVVVSTAPSESADELVLAYNIGSDQSHTAGDGRVFAADDLGVGQRDSNPIAIAETDDEPLYQSGAYGPQGLSYDFVIDNGIYVVTLHFAEIWEPAFTPGTRVFDVEIEGALVADALDVAATAGPGTAYQTQYATTVTDGQLEIELINLIENPILSGIEIERKPDEPVDTEAGGLDPGLMARDIEIFL